MEKRIFLGVTRYNPRSSTLGVVEILHLPEGVEKQNLTLFTVGI